MDFSQEDIQAHSVFNELDSHGLALGLKRLSNEKNAEYKQRILDVFINKSNSSYQGLLNGITRKLGFSFNKEFTIIPTDISTNPNAAIFFKDTRCCIYQDYYGSPTLFEEIDRWNLKINEGYTLQDLKESIESYPNSSSPYFRVILEEDTDLSKRSMTIYDQNSIETVIEESLVGKGTVINLNNRNLIEGGEYIRSRTLTKKLASSDVTPHSDFKKEEYRINYITGKIECGSTPGSQSYINYTHRNDKLEIFSSPIILNNIQSEEFRKLMLEQVLQEDGSYTNGRPLVFGADIINELLSVYPTTYGK